MTAKQILSEIHRHGWDVREKDGEFQLFFRWFEYFWRATLEECLVDAENYRKP